MGESSKTPHGLNRVNFDNSMKPCYIKNMFLRCCKTSCKRLFPGNTTYCGDARGRN